MVSLRLKQSAGPLTLALVIMAGATPSRANAQTDSSFISEWQARATASQAEQPRWVTPINTVTPRLEQELRYDVTWRTAPSGIEADLYGGGKGLELIPFTPIELIVGVPNYTQHNNPNDPNGFGDWPLLLKYRIFSNNADHGDDILTVFLGATLPTGGSANGSGKAVITPTLAGGKGMGDFDIQATAGIALPAGDESAIGRSEVYNVTAQDHLSRFLWPEVEINGTHWQDGVHDGTNLAGLNQVFLTPGVVLGRFPISGRTGFTVGVGIQTAVSSYHQYNHAWTLSLRLPF
jgi:hypothetical protein